MQLRSWHPSHREAINHWEGDRAAEQNVPNCSACDRNKKASQDNGLEKLRPNRHRYFFSHHRRRQNDPLGRKMCQTKSAARLGADISTKTQESLAARRSSPTTRTGPSFQVEKATSSHRRRALDNGQITTPGTEADEYHRGISTVKGSLGILLQVAIPFSALGWVRGNKYQDVLCLCQTTNAIVSPASSGRIITYAPTKCRQTLLAEKRDDEHYAPFQPFLVLPEATAT